MTFDKTTLLANLQDTLISTIKRASNNPACLIVVRGPQQGKRFELSGASMSLGRDAAADILIDDNIEFIRDAAACGVVGILLDKPWNRNYEIPDTAVRVSGWDEIPAMVERLRKRTP